MTKCLDVAFELLHASCSVMWFYVQLWDNTATDTYTFSELKNRMFVIYYCNHHHHHYFLPFIHLGRCTIPWSLIVRKLKVVSFFPLLFFAIIQDSFAASMDIEHKHCVIFFTNISVTTPTLNCSSIAQGELVWQMRYLPNLTDVVHIPIW